MSNASTWIALLAACLSYDALAQTATTDGSCVDSTCARRAVTLSGMGSSSTNTSGTWVAPENHCKASTQDNPNVPCPSGYVGSMHTTTTTSCPSGVFGPRKTTTSAYDKSSCSPAPQGPPTGCSPGYGSTSRGDVGYCTDCDTVGWNPSAYNLNYTSQQQACYLKYSGN